MESIDIKIVSVATLNKISSNKKIWCFGCGKILFELCEKYTYEPFVSQIEHIADNNENLWGKEKLVGIRKLNISNPAILEWERANTVILLITSNYEKEIFESLKKFFGGKRLRVFRYPRFYSPMAGLLLKVFGLAPLKQQILFYAGSEPHENADVISDYIHMNNKKTRFEVIYLTDEDDEEKQYVKYIHFKELQQKSNFYTLWNFCLNYSRSRFLCYENEPLSKTSKKQKLVFLNHGTIPLKNVKDVLKQPDSVDYAFCPGEGCADFYINQYGILKNKLVFSMPARVSRMLNKKGRLDEILERDNRQIIMWLPTFRQIKGSNRKDSDTSPTGNFSYFAEEIDKRLEANNQLLMIKYHPKEKERNKVFLNAKNIILIEDEELKERRIILQELFPDVDALLTDYSGIAFEYVLLNRPIGYVISDIATYERGFSVDDYWNYMPGEKITNKDEFILFLDKVKSGDDKYAIARKELITRLYGEKAYENGAERFVDFLKDVSRV